MMMDEDHLSHQLVSAGIQPTEENKAALQRLQTTSTLSTSIEAASNVEDTSLLRNISALRTDLKNRGSLTPQLATSLWNLETRIKSNEINPTQAWSEYYALQNDATEEVKGHPLPSRWQALVASIRNIFGVTHP